MKIGLFDSGIGGLTVLSYLRKLLPDEEYYYYADTENVPYGTKTSEEIISLSRQAAKFLVSKGCDIICIACNTATSVAAATLRSEMSVPIVGIEPAVKPAVSLHRDGRVLVVATPVTVREKKLKNLIERVDEEHLVDMLSLEKLPSFAEKGDFDSKELRDYLNASFESIDTDVYSCVVLGCTHFIHFEDVLREFFCSDVLFIDGCEGTARNIKRIVTNMGLESSNGFKESFYKSGVEVTDARQLDFYHMILDRLE